jgi:ACS family glucarate transporter-like MFS transporter
LTRTEGATVTERPTSIRWRVCVLIGLASFTAYLLRTNMSVAGAPMAEDLGLTQVQLGVVLAGFAWAYALFQFPGGVLGDVLGARRAVALLAVTWGLGNLLVAAVPARGAASTTTLLLALVGARVLMGIAQAPFFPITGGAATCNWFPVSGWALPGSLQNAGLTFGSAAAGPLIAWLSVRYGWRQSFALTAPLGFLVAAVWWWYVRDYPSQHPRVNRAERDLIDAGRRPGDCVPPEPGAWRAVLRHPPLLMLTAGYTCSNYVFYFFFNWLFVYLIESRGFKLLEGGFYAAAPWIAGAFGAVLGGWVCDRLWKRWGARMGCRVPGAIAMVLCGLFLIGAAAAPGPLLAVVLLSLCLGAQQFVDPIYWAAAIAVSGRRAGAACGVLNTGGNLIGGVGALLVPLTVRHAGWTAALATGSLFALAAAACWLVTRPDEAVDQPAAAPGPALA